MAKLLDMQSRLSEWHNKDAALEELRSWVKVKLPVAQFEKTHPNTFAEWLGRCILLTGNSTNHCYRVLGDINEILEKESSHKKFSATYAFKADLSPKVRDFAYETAHEYNLYINASYCAPRLTILDDNVYVSGENERPLILNFLIPDSMEDSFQLSRKHLKTRLEKMESLYQEFKKTEAYTFITYDLDIPKELYISEEDLAIARFFFLIKHTINTDYHQRDKKSITFDTPLKFTRYLTRKIGVNDDVVMSEISENIDFTLSFINESKCSIQFLNNKGLVEFYKDPYGINSCMTGEARQYCVQSYLHNPNCGLAVFKKRGVVKARSLIYMTDAGVKVHCNVYLVGGVSTSECQDLLKEKGFTDIRTLYGKLESWFGRPSKAFKCSDMYGLKPWFSDWVKDSSLPEECRKEAEALMGNVECSNKAMPEFFTWVQKWFTLTFVTNEDHNLPFLDSFGMWRTVKTGKNLQLEGLPIRNNFGNQEWTDLRTPMGPGKPYQEKQGPEDGKDARLFSTEEEYLEKAHPRLGYNKGNPGWKRCVWSGYWFNPDIWGSKSVLISAEKSGWVMDQHHNKFRYMSIYLHDRKYVGDFWAYHLVYVKSLGIYLNQNSYTDYVTYDKDKSYVEPQTNLLVITDENVIVKGFNDEHLKGNNEEMLENNNKAFEDIQFIEVVDLKKKKAYNKEEAKA